MALRLGQMRKSLQEIFPIHQMLDEEFTNINMMIKYYKFGFGRATDILNEQIRGNIITRKKAIKIAEKI